MVHAMRGRAMYVPTYSVSTLSLGGHAGVALASPCPLDDLQYKVGAGSIPACAGEPLSNI